MLMSAATDAALKQRYPAQRVLVLGDTSEARRAGGDAVDSLGLGPASMLPLEDGMARLAQWHPWAAVMLELRGEPADVLEPLLDKLETQAGQGRPSIITVPLGLIDLVAAHAGHEAISILCDPDPMERAGALGVALARTSTRLRDVTADAGAVRLRQLSEEVGRIARTLASLSSESGTRPGLRGAPLLEGLMPGSPASGGREIDAATIRAIIRARRLRDQFFDRELFADPAWDILLDLTAARLESTPVAVSSLCIAAAVPPTTALRWIKTLTEAGLLVRAADTRDGRRVFIELSEPAAAGMIAYLQAVARTGTLLA